MKSRKPQRREPPSAASRTHELSSSFEDQVRDLSRRFRLGLFGVDLFATAEELHALSADRDPRADPIVLKCRCTCAEIFDQQGRLDLAQAAVKEAEDVYARLRELPLDSTRLADLKLAREQVRFVADFARLHLYRRGQFVAAKERLEFCAAMVRTTIRRATFRCHGTMGLIQYYAGCAERQLGHFDEADGHYGEAINEYRARAESAAGLKDQQRLEEERALVRHNCGVILGLGLGWTNSQRGFLSTALASNILPAQVLLMTSADQTHQSYLSLLRGSATRSLIGSSDSERLAEARQAIEQARNAFIRAPYCHESYAMRAEYELALCALTEGDYAEASRLIDHMEERAKKPGSHDARWQANAWLVRSRITSRRGKDPAKARDEADKAFVLMSGHEESLGVIDARIARAEAALNLGETRAALDDLQRALDIVMKQRKPNQKIESVIRILMARGHLAQDERQLAEQHYAIWQVAMNNVEHRLVHEMAAGVGAKLHQLKADFTIPFSSGDLEYDTHERRMRAWLVNRASSFQTHDQTKADVAKTLGVSRATLNHWENELQKELKDLKKAPP